jgi:hypothetical protein
MNRHTPDLSEHPKQGELGVATAPIELTGADLDRVAGGIIIGVQPLRPQWDNSTPLPW